jgi:hypothetical protein
VAEFGGVIASTFVRVRADTTGFRTEAESGVKRAMVGIGKVVGGVFAAAGAVDVFKHVAQAAAEHQAEFATLDRVMKNAGVSARGFGASLDSVLAKEARLKGFSDSDLAQAFLRLVSVTHSSQKAFHDLQLAEDLSRARHINLAVAALTLSKAEQGSVMSFLRLGIVVPKVTTHIDALRKQHDLAVASGAKFTGAAAAEYKAQEAAAQAADKHARSVLALQIVQNRYGGTAGVFAKTAAGEFARFGEQIHQLEISVGTVLLPPLTRAAEGLGHFVQGLTTSGRAANTVKSVMSSLGSVFNSVKGAVQAVAPPIEALVKGIADVAKAIGVGPIVVALGAFKAVRVALEAAAAAQLHYNALVAASAAAEKAQAAGTSQRIAARTAYNNTLKAGIGAETDSSISEKANTVAQQENSSARQLNVAAQQKQIETLAASTAATEAQTAGMVSNSSRLQQISYSILGTPTRQRNALGQFTSDIEREGGAIRGLAATATTAGRTIGSALFQLAGGRAGLIVGGVAAAAFGIYKLVTAETDLQRETGRVTNTMAGLAATMGALSKDSQGLAQALSSVKSDQIAVQSDQIAVAQAKQALATTKAKEGTLAYTILVNQLSQAYDTLRQAQTQLTNDQGSANAAQRRQLLDLQTQAKQRITLLSQIRSEEGKAAHSISGAGTGAIQTIASGARFILSGVSGALKAIGGTAGRGSPVQGLFNAVAGGFKGLAGDTNINTVRRTAEETANRFAHSLNVTAEALKAQHPFYAQEVEDLSLMVRGLKTLPPQKVVEVFIKTGSARAAFEELVKQFEKTGPTAAKFKNFFDQQADAIRASDPALARRIRYIQDLVQVTGKIPSRKLMEIVLRSSNAQSAVSAIEKYLETLGGSGSKAGTQWVIRFVEALQSGHLLQGVKNVLDKATASAAGSALSALSTPVLESQLTAVNQAVSAARQGVDAAKQTLDQATQSVTQAQTNLTTAIQQGNQQVADAVHSAGRNLFTIGSAIDSLLQQFIDAQNKAQNIIGPNAETFARLRQQILGKPQTPASARAATELANQVNEQAAVQAAAGQTAVGKAKAGIADLIDEFNRGLISLPQFNKRIAQLLASDGFSYAAAGKKLGIAFADSFRAELSALREQAQAIIQGGRLPGIAALVHENIVRPAVVEDRVAHSIQRAHLAISTAILREEKARTQYNAKEATLAKAEQHQAALKDLIAKNNETAKKTEHNTGESARLLGIIAGQGGPRAGRAFSGRPGILPPGVVAGPQNVGEVRAQLRLQATAGESARSGSRLARSIGAAMVAEAQSIGLDLSKGLVRGLESGEHDAFARFIREVLKRGRSAARARSPSLETYDLAVDLIRGLSLGFGDSAASTALQSAFSGVLNNLLKLDSGRVAALAKQLSAAIPATLPVKQIRQRVDLAPSPPKRLRQLINVDALPAKTLQQHIEVPPPLLKRLRQMVTVEPLVPKTLRQIVAVAALTPKTLRQAVTVEHAVTERETLRSLIARLTSVAAIPYQTVRQQVSVEHQVRERETLASLVARLTIIPAVAARVVRQLVRVEHSVTENERLRDAIARTIVPPPIPPKTLIQQIKVEKRLLPVTEPANLRTLIAQSSTETAIPRKRLTQEIAVTRRLREGTNVREALAQAEKIGQLSRGASSVTVHVGVEVASAKRAIDHLYETTAGTKTIQTRVVLSQASLRQAEQQLDVFLRPRTLTVTPVVGTVHAKAKTVESHQAELVALAKADRTLKTQHHKESQNEQKKQTAALHRIHAHQQTPPHRPNIKRPGRGSAQDEASAVAGLGG